MSDKYQEIKRFFLRLIDHDNNINNDSQDDIGRIIKEFDLRANQETTPPPEEIIKIPCLWTFEVYTPSFISNFHTSLKKLGWLKRELGSEKNFIHKLNKLRYQSEGGGCIDLGYIVNESQQFFTETKKAKLPNGIKRIRASLLHFLPSTSILACKFEFEENLAISINEPLCTKYFSYKEKTANGYRVISVMDQKQKAVLEARKNLRRICTSWLADNLPGFFASGYSDAQFPVCELILLSKHKLYKKKEKFPPYLRMFDVYDDYYAWKCDKLQGLFLYESNNYDNYNDNPCLVLLGNINNILFDKNLSNNGKSREEQVLKYLNRLDRSLAIWVLSVVLKIFEMHINKLRDLYGKIDVLHLNKITDKLLELVNQCLEIQKNAIPYAYELKEFCKQPKIFMLFVLKFYPVNDSLKEYSEEFFDSIRRNLLLKVNLLLRNEQMLRNTSETMRVLAMTISSNNLAQKNISLQRKMLWLSLIMLIFTIIAGISAFVEINKNFHLLKWIKLLFTNLRY